MEVTPKWIMNQQFTKTSVTELRTIFKFEAFDDVPSPKVTLLS